MSRTPPTLGELITKAAAHLPDLESPSAADVGAMLKRIEEAIGAQLVALVQDANRRRADLLSGRTPVRWSPETVDTPTLGYLIGSIAYLAQRWEGLDDLPPEADAEGEPSS